MIPLYPVTSHTDHVGPGTTFVAVPGYVQNGTIYIQEAITRGASTIVCEESASLNQDLLELLEQRNINLIRVPNARKALAELSCIASKNAVNTLKIVGITGTKGKTTTSWLLHHVLNSAGIKTALLSTVANKIGDQTFPATLTTAQADYLHPFFAHCVEQGITHVVMEIAAQAVTTHRVHGIPLDGLIFTNFAREHLEFYTSMEDYFQAKTALFSSLKKDASVVIGADHPWKDRLQSIAPMSTQWTSCFDTEADFYFQSIKNTYTAGIVYHKNMPYEYYCPHLIGTFNAQNMVMAIAMSTLQGVSPSDIQSSLKTFAGVPGRLEQYTLPNGARAIIDYAHNPLSYEAILPELRSISDHLILVFGAGGSRDAGRRPLMGAIAAHYADQIILTTDNPRLEDPATIVIDILKGIDKADQHKVQIELDRQKAIEMAYQMSRPTSTIALLGKGPESYQIVGTTKMPFSEAQILKSLL